MEGGLEKIQTLEDSLVRTRDEKTVETKGQAPVFTVPLSNVDNLREGESAHFEARLTPTDDPKLKVRIDFNSFACFQLVSCMIITNILIFYKTFVSYHFSKLHDFHDFHFCVNINLSFYVKFSNKHLLKLITYFFTSNL